MKLVADSGSTKTDWVILSDGAVEGRFSTSGLNPFVMGIERFSEVVRDELVPRIYDIYVDEVEFYGAGCTVVMQPLVRACFEKLIPSANKILVDSDLLGACRAVCKGREGIVAILGTGSNSCLYDGHAIVQTTPSLGFILGDEGSGAALGRLFLNALLKKRLPKAVEEAFHREFELTQSDILERIYQGEQANTFLASFAPFVHVCSYDEDVRALIIGNFRQFFTNNIRQYGRTDLLVHCIGGMAYHFSDCLERAARLEGFALGEILCSPLEKLI